MINLFKKLKVKQARLKLSLLAMGASVCLFSNAVAKPLTTQSVELYRLPINYMVTYDPVEMPAGLNRMGLLGINILPRWWPHLSVGLSGYGALTGDNGGLFTLGLTADYQYPLWHQLKLDVNAFAGGGGGRSSYAGDGFMWRAAAGLAYGFHYFGIGAHYSYVKFPSGKISSGQVGLDLYLSMQSLFASPGYMGSAVLGNFTYSKNYISVITPFYFQKSGTKNTSGEVQDGTIKLLGVEVGHFFTPHFYYLFNAAGAYSGIPNGFMDIFGGLGYRQPLFSHLAATAELNLGTGGGAKVDTGGGFLVNPQVGLIWNVYSHWALGLNGGYLRAPDGDLTAWTAGLKLIYQFQAATLDFSGPVSTRADIVGWRMGIGDETYLHPQRTGSLPDDNISLIDVKIDRILSPHFYVGGEAQSAFSGEQAGGLAVGMFGLGLQTSEKRAWQAYLECMAGAVGGGGLDVGDGAVAEPRVGVRVHIGTFLGLQASVGRIVALEGKGDLDATTLGASIFLRTGGVVKHEG